MNIQKQHGFSALIIVLLIALVGVIGFVGWRMYDASQQANSQQATQNTNNQTQQPTDPNEGYVVIKEWGVRFKPVEGLTGVEYFKPNALNSDNVTFTTTELSRLSTYCSSKNGDIILGLLSRSSAERERAGSVVAKIGEYYYQYAGPQAACTESSEHDAIESKTITALSKSLNSLEAAK
jgi:hypothetical protein